jgi:cell division protein DivIC
VNRRRIFLQLYVLALLGLAGWAGLFFLEMRAEFNLLKQSEASIRRQLADERARLAEQNRILERLKSDPAYVTRVLRRLNYAKPDELVFRFED